MSQLRFNCKSSFDVHLDGDEFLHRGEVILSKVVNDGRYEAFICKTNIEGIYGYGLKQLYENAWSEHGAGYVWASRPGVMNKIFGTKLVSCCYKTSSCAIDEEVLESILPENYYIEADPVVDDEDVVYRVVERK